MNIKNILISQSQTDKAAYDALEAKYGIKVHFRPFITIKPVSMKVFRAQKVNILDYTAIIFTSKNAVDIFFQFCKNLRIEMPPEMKYFCVNETTANYIQHHVQMRKRKVFVGKGNNQDLFPLFKKHSTEKYLYPCSEIRKSDIPDFMKQNNILCKELIIYETVSADLKDLNIYDYQLIAFFSPSGVTALKENFPDYKQGDTLFAAFGSTTAKAIQDANFRVDIQAPIPQIPSMVGAIELKLKELSDPKGFKKYLKQLEAKLEQQLEEEKKLKEQQLKEKALKQQKASKKEINQERLEISIKPDDNTSMSPPVSDENTSKQSTSSSTSPKKTRTRKSTKTNQSTADTSTDISLEKESFLKVSLTESIKDKNESIKSKKTTTVKSTEKKTTAQKKSPTTKNK
ncbi:MAG: uroporphyrinogen-III synthase [Bacteroidia bacterium]|nr:uroporphyrinogen-III synthase [Bacteroidia bacterium]